MANGADISLQEMSFYVGQESGSMLISQALCPHHIQNCTNMLCLICMQILLSPAAMQVLEPMPAVSELLSYILVRDPLQRPKARDVSER